MKILFCSDAHGTGFSSACSVLINNFVKITNWDIHLFAINFLADDKTIKDKTLENYNLPRENIHTPLLPKIVNPKHKYSRELISNSLYGCYNVAKICEYVNPDIVFIFNDLYPTEWIYKSIKNGNWKGKILAYIPIDCEINKGAMDEHFGIDKIIATSEFGRLSMIGSGYNKKIPVIYHPIKDSFSLLSEEDKLKFRKIILKDNSKKFIIINPNKNQFRKRQDITIEGFSIFSKDKDDVLLLLKCEKNEENIEGRYNIKDLMNLNMKNHDLKNDKIIINDENLTYEQLNILYNICDCTLSTTSGEGFGYIPLEFAKLKKPSLISANTTYLEFFTNYQGLIPSKKSKPIVSMGNSVEIKDDSSLILFQCYKKKYTSDSVEIENIISFDNQVIDNFNIKSLSEINKVIENVIKNNNILSFQVSTLSGVNLTNYKKIYDSFNPSKLLLDNFKLVMIDKKYLKTTFDSYKLNSYIPTAQSVADKLEEFYNYWKKGIPLPIPELNEKMNTDYIISQFKNEIENILN